MRVKFPNGKEYECGLLGLSEEACEMLELQERFQDTRPDSSDDDGGFNMLTFARCMRACIVQSMEAGGNSTETIREACKAVPIMITKVDGFYKDLLRAMMGMEVEGGAE